MPRRRRQFTPVEWLILISIVGILLAIAAPSRSSRSRTIRRPVPAAAARSARPASSIELPEADKRDTSPPSALRLWRRLQNVLVLVLALHVIARALRRRPTSPAAHRGAPAP